MQTDSFQTDTLIPDSIISVRPADTILHDTNSVQIKQNTATEKQVEDSSPGVEEIKTSAKSILDTGRKESVLIVKDLTPSVPTVISADSLPDSYFFSADLQNIVDGARQGALYWESKVEQEVPCIGYDVAPAPLFEIGSYEEIDGSTKSRNIVATFSYYDCGPCKGKSIRIKP